MGHGSQKNEGNTGNKGVGKISALQRGQESGNMRPAVNVMITSLLIDCHAEQFRPESMAVRGTSSRGLTCPECNRVVEPSPRSVTMRASLMASCLETRFGFQN